MAIALDSSDVVLVMTTVSSSADADSLVRALLAERLIACGTILPTARSLYHWEGEIAEEPEVVLLLKTQAARLDALGEAFAELHPYEVPELLVFPTHAGLEGYLGWVRDEADGGG